MRVLSLFAGIGGMDLGLERAGMTVVGQVEIDPFCRRVLRKHWPDVWQWDDVTTLTGDMVRENCGEIDFICGGFPCQDISNAGKRAGIDGERSGLWREFARLIREIRPRYVLVENVAALLVRGIGRVLGDLADIRYDAEWKCISAGDVGAKHLRQRVWIVAYPAGDGRNQKRTDAERIDKKEGGEWNGESVRGVTRGSSRKVSDANCPRLERAWLSRAIADHPEWLPEPAVARVVDGVSGLVDRIRTLGNAVVPQVAEFIGRAILRGAA